MKFNRREVRIAVLGLGYVGLPLAVEFGKSYPTIGYDISQSRVEELKAGHDHTLEVSPEKMSDAKRLKFSDKYNDLQSCNVFVVTVPTPVDANRKPDLTPLLEASKVLGRVIKKNDIIIYESTVFPGATEEDCVPVVESESGLVFNKDFFVGYSPERINPGDKSRPLTSIRKVTSGSTPDCAEFVDSLYSSIIEAGTFKASSIKVAEASKVIENTQRDVNIALINELSIVFDQLGINTQEVIEAASTKWNFVKLFPGLVGGHCISVDPYYLLHKSIAVGYTPDIIRVSREINDGMAKYISSDFVKKLIKSKVDVGQSRILIVGFTFKKDCPDTRNTKVYDLVKELESYDLKVEVFDPLVSKEDIERYGDVTFVKQINEEYQAAIIAVNHTSAYESGAIERLIASVKVFYDLSKR